MSITPGYRHASNTTIAFAYIFFLFAALALWLGPCQEAYPQTTEVTTSTLRITTNSDTLTVRTIIKPAPPTSTIPPTPPSTVPPTAGLSLTVTATGSPHFFVRVKGVQVASVTMNAASNTYFFAGSYSPTDKIEVQFDNDSTGVDLFVVGLFVNGTALNLASAAHLPVPYGGWEVSNGRFAMYQNDILTLNGTAPPPPATTTSTVAPTPTNSPPSGTLVIPTTHPRLWWNASRLARARAWNTANPYTPPSPVTNGDDAFKNAFAYRVTSFGAYARAAINWLNGYSFPPSQTSPSSIGSDNSRWDGENVICIYDWCWDQMTATERSDFRAKFGPAFVNISQQSWGGLGMPANNYFHGNLRNEIEYGIACNGEDSNAATLLNFALNQRWPALKAFAQGAGKGGVLAEGPSYGPVVASYMIVPFVSCYSLGRDLTSETSYYEDIARWMNYETLPPTTALGDASPAHWTLFPFNDMEYPDKMNFSSRKYTQNYMTAFLEFGAGRPIGGLAALWLGNTKAVPDAFLQALQLNPTAQPYPAALSYTATGVQYCYAGNWNGTRIMLSFGVPKGAGHLHRDAGQFQIWKNGQWIVRESAGYSVSITGGGINEPVAHNIALINGVGPQPDSWQLSPPVLLSYAESATGFTASVDLTGTYLLNSDFANRVPPLPVAKISKYIRTATFTFATGVLKIDDTINATAPITITELIHTEVNPYRFNLTGVSVTRIVNEGTFGQTRLECDQSIPANMATTVSFTITPL